MRIISIRLHNVFRFGETDNLINLDEVFAKSQDDIVLIIGSIDDDDQDSNGAGKSTVGEALYWAFFKSVPRLMRNSSKKGKAVAEIIRTDDSGEIADGITESFVEVFFKTKDGREWRLKRGCKITKTKNYSSFLELDCDGTPIGGEKEDLIADMIGVGPDSVLNSILFAQMDTGKFLSGTDSDRRNILMDLRGLTVIDKMLKEIRENYKKETTKAHEDIIVKMDMVRDRIEGENEAELRKRKLDAAKSIEGVDEKVAKNEEKIATLEKSEDKEKARGINERLEKLESELGNVRKERESAMADLNETADTIAKQIEENDGRKKKLESRKNEIQAEFDEANKVVKSHSKETLESRQAEIDGAKSEITKVKEEISNASHQIEDLVEESSSLKADVSNVEKSLVTLADLKERGECPTCGNECPEGEIDRKIEDADKEKKTLESELEKKEASLKEIRELKGKHQVKLAEHEKVASGESQLILDIERIKTAKQTLKTCRIRAEEVKTDADEIAKTAGFLEEKRVSTQEKIKIRSGEYDTKEANFEKLVNECKGEMEGLSEKVEKIDDEISSLKKTNSELIDSKSSVAEEIGRIDEKLESRKKDLDLVSELKKQEKAEKKRLDRILYLEKILSGSVKSDVADSCVPLLNFYANEFMNILRDGVRLDISSKDDKIVIRIIGSAATAYNMSSGGEQAAMRLAVSMALSMISIGGAADIPDMIFLDEIFGALDSKTKNSVFRLLKRLNRNFDRIIVITHDHLLKERFRTRIHIDKQDGVSHVVY